MMMKRQSRSFGKLLALLTLLTLLCAVGFGAAWAEESSFPELLENGSFEELDGDGLPVGWRTEAYNLQEGYTYFSVAADEAHDGTNSAVIQNLGENDARFAQTVQVEPESLYCLSGYIRTAEVPDSGHGANLSIEGLYVFSEGVYETTEDWQYITFYGETGPDQTEVTIFVRLGGYSGESLGKAWFDEISLKQVDAVPGDGVATLWFASAQPQEQVVAAVDDGEEDAAPFWPWLLVIGALYLLFGVAAAAMLTKEKEELRPADGKRRAPAFLTLGLVLAVLSRLVVGCMVTGYQVDVNCFRAWASMMQNLGPAGFYTSGAFCDYPPAYLYVLWLDQGIIDLLQSAPQGFVTWFTGLGLGSWYDVSTLLTLKLVPVLCDVIAAYLVYRFALRTMTRKTSGVLALLVAFNPAFFLNSAAWCQMDSVLCLGLMLVAWFAIDRKWMAVIPLYVLCVLIKPQALMLGFLGLTALVLVWLRHKDERKAMLRGVYIAALVAVLILTPFSIGQSWDWLVKQYANTLASYPYATVNTANLYYLFGANWDAVANPCSLVCALLLAAGCFAWGAILWKRQRDFRLPWLESALMAVFGVFFALCGIAGASWSILGYGAMALAFAIVLPLYVRGGKLENLPLLGGLLFLLLYVLGIKMHERYLFPALLFFAMAFVLKRDRRVLTLLLVTTVTMFLNEGIVLDNSIRLGSSLGHLNADTVVLASIVACVNLLCAGLGVWTAQRLVAEGGEPLAAASLPVGTRLDKRPCSVLDVKTDAGLHWKKLDTLLLVSVMAVYAVVAFWNLGSTKAPQNPWKSTSATEQVVIDLGEHRDNAVMLYFAQVSYSNFTIATSEDGTLWSEEIWADMAQGECFQWKYLTTSAEQNGKRTFTSTPVYLNGRYVRITAQQIGLILDEILFRQGYPDDVSIVGETFPATIASVTGQNEESTLLSDPANLLDEQDTLDGQPSWYNGTYFDEIYHARTAFEHANGTKPYETTHPPLGKLLMALCVQLFGMTPFGWRFAGCLAGVFMLPAMYLLGKQLTKRTSIGFAAMAMMALDCMHLTQTRIATIDSFPVLFILFAYFFMLRFMQRDLMAQPVKKLLPDLAFSGLFISLAIASKWIGLYAAVGLAVLFFWTCARHIRLRGEAIARMDDKALDADTRKALHLRADETVKRLLTLCLWCVLFFVVLPVTVYLLCYIPYFAYLGKQSLSDFLRNVVSAQIGMFDYHSTPGLGMDHPYYSPWYEWPLIKRPMWYAMAQYMPEGLRYSIFCFGNPAVWLTGLAGIACTLVVWFKRHVYRLPNSEAILHPQGQSDSVAPAFVLIGLLAQILPWMLVPRGTYIYHYFASVPFLILGTSLAFFWLQKHYPKLGKILLIVYLSVCLVFFVAYYPYASGTTVPTEWLDFMRKFLRIYY